MKTTGVLVLVFVIMGFLTYRVWTKKPKPKSDARATELLAALVDNLDTDMRSAEIGRWFAYRLASASSGKVCVPASSADIEGIVADTPNLNIVSASETRRVLRILAELAAVQSCVDPAVSTSERLRAYALDAFGPPGFENRGSLASVGYRPRSIVTLRQ